MEDKLLELEQKNKELKTQLDTLKNNEEYIKSFTENYEKKGLCEGIDNFVKTINKEFKKTNTLKIIKYLPWAVVERIFHLQGGRIEIINFKEEVAFDFKGINIETGEFEEETKKALFIHLRGYWKGKTLDEYYPIFDNQTSKVLKTPDAQQLNTSRQRGSVRLIARLSGIGLHIFEQQDDDFEDNNEEVNTKKPTKKESEEVEIEKHKTTKQIQKETHKEKVVEVFEEIFEEKPNEEEIKQEQNNIHDMLSGKVVETEKIIPPKVEIQEEYSNETEQYQDLILEIKANIKEFRDFILDFMRNVKKKNTLSELAYSELLELKEELKGKGGKF